MPDFDHALLDGMVNDAGEKLGIEDPARVIVNLGHGHAPGFDGFFELCAEVVGHGLFLIEAGRGGLLGAVSSTPVREHEAFEAPLVLKCVAEQVGVLAGVVAIDAVVGTHDRAGIGDGDGNVKGKQIGFLQGRVWR